MIEKILRNCSGTIYFTGVGKSGIIAQLFASSLRSVGVSAGYLSSLDWSHGDIGCIKANDKMVFLSDSGETKEVLELCFYVKRNMSIETIYVGSVIDSTLAITCDESCIYYKDPLKNPLGLPSQAISSLITEFYTSFQNFIESSVVAETVGVAHPYGVIGLKNRLAHSLPDEKLINNILSLHDVTVENIILEITRFGVGAVVIVDDLSRVINVVTDGDIRRLGLGAQLKKFAINQRAVVTGKASNNLFEIKEMIKSTGVTSLPITDDDGTFLFSLSVKDL